MNKETKEITRSDIKEDVKRYKKYINAIESAPHKYRNDSTVKNVLSFRDKNGYNFVSDENGIKIIE